MASKKTWVIAIMFVIVFGSYAHANQAVAREISQFRIAVEELERLVNNIINVGRNPMSHQHLNQLAAISTRMERSASNARSQNPTEQQRMQINDLETRGNNAVQRLWNSGIRTP